MYTIVQYTVYSIHYSTVYNIVQFTLQSTTVWSKAYYENDKKDKKGIFILVRKFTRKEWGFIDDWKPFKYNDMKIYSQIYTSNGIFNELAKNLIKLKLHWTLNVRKKSEKIRTVVSEVSFFVGNPVAKVAIGILNLEARNQFL